MRKDRTCKVVFSLSNGKWDINGASCGCPAGKGPRATCKHIEALSYLFQSFCGNSTIPEFLFALNDYKTGTSQGVGK